MALEDYYRPSDLKARIGEFVNHYKAERYHESLNNLTPEDVSTGRGQIVSNRRKKIEQKTIEQRIAITQPSRWQRNYRQIQNQVTCQNILTIRKSRLVTRFFNRRIVAFTVCVWYAGKITVAT